MLDALEHCMISVRDATQGSLPNSIRVAAQAALLLIDKYFSLTDECEVYAIAIGNHIGCYFVMIFNAVFILVMCPDRKLKWFKDRGRTTAQIEDIRKLVINRWEESYKPLLAEPQMSIPTDLRNVGVRAFGNRPNMFLSYYLQLPHARQSKWVASSMPASAHAIDNIITYLDDPVVAPNVIQEAGGLMKYWHQAATTRPCISKMASDFCSAPGM
jgi:hypothetical protein